MLHSRWKFTQLKCLKYFTRDITKHESVTPQIEMRQLTVEDMPQPFSLPLLGTKSNFLLTGSGSTLHEYIHRRHTELGPIFRESLGGRDELVFVSEPLMLKSLFLNLEGKYPVHILPEPWTLYEKLYGSKRGLFFMNGEEWLTNRRIMNKHLLREGADKYLEVSIKDTVSNFIEEWKIKAGQDTFIPDLETEFYKLSLNVIINVLIGTKSNLKASKHNKQLLEMFSQAVKKIFQTTNLLYSLPVHWCERLNLKVWRNFKESIDLSLYLGQKIVHEMLRMKQKSDGLIGKIDEMNDETIVRIVTDLVIAAGDTTAYTTMWILMLLSSNADVKKDILINDDYAKHVVKETMRLYPVAPFLTRILTAEGTLGPYKIKEGTPIIASIYTSGRDESNFTRANEFLPHRWVRNDPRRQNLVNHVTSASLPFALGARSCVGKKIAMLQLTEITKQIVHNFDFRCLNTAKIKPIMSLVLIPNQKVKLQFKLRNN